MKPRSMEQLAAVVIGVCHSLRVDHGDHVTADSLCNIVGSMIHCQTITPIHNTNEYLTNEEHEYMRVPQSAGGPCRIKAVKSVRDRTGMTLKECIDLVDKFYPRP